MYSTNVTNFNQLQNLYTKIYKCGNSSPVVDGWGRMYVCLMGVNKFNLVSVICLFYLYHINWEASSVGCHFGMNSYGRWL